MSDTVQNEVSLVELFQDLLNIGDRLKKGILDSINKDIAEKAKKAELNEDSEEEDDDEEEENEQPEESEEEDEEFDEDDEEADSKKAKQPKEKKPPKKKTELEELLISLHLPKYPKQNLMIKKAILLKFEEVLFGNNNITMTFDLRKMGNEEEKDGKLEEILECKDLTKYMPRSMTDSGNSLEFVDKEAFREVVSAAKAPPDILKPLRPKTPKKVAVNLIKKQYDIRWNTNSGESRQFDFYELPKHFAKGVVRKAHMQTLLYQHKADIANLLNRLSSTGTLEAENFCPENVYLKKDPYRKEASAADDTVPIRARDEPKYAWQRFEVQSGECTELGFEFPSELKWIHPKVKTLIRKLCHPIEEEFSPETTENLMYLIVVQETTSKTLSEVGNCSQIYVGGADEGIRKKFLEGDDCHCNKLKQLYQDFSTMETFTPNSTALLVELRLLLALARRESFAVFALRAFDQPRTLGRELHDLIRQALYLADNEIWGPAVNMKFGLNLKEELKKRRKFLPDEFPGSRRRKRK